MLASKEMSLERSSKDEAIPSFAEFLDALSEGDEKPPVYKTVEDAGTTFRFIYDGWVERGSYERGKPRHSVRQIKKWLGDDDHIRSLETKLAGKTRLKHNDALSLFKLFISHWTHDKDGNQYEPYFNGDIDQLAKNFTEKLFRDKKEAILLPMRTRSSANGVSPPTTAAFETEPLDLKGTRPTGEVIKELFAKSDALITISREITVVGSDPPSDMRDFHYLLEELYRIDQQDQRKRTLIWIIDFGLRKDQLSARRTIYNFYFLVAQFRAIALIEREGRDEFYTWLNRNVCFVVGSLKIEEIERFYKNVKLELPSPPADKFWLQSDRLFLESVPGRWLDAPGSEAYGRSQKELWDSPTITAHLKLDDWDLDHPEEVDDQKNLRYVFHGEIKSDSDSVDDGSVRCIPLPEPGARWSDAYRLAVQAALGRLRRPRDRRISEIDYDEALAMLATQHFAVLRLREFAGLARTLVDEAYDSLKSSSV